ncbi:uncharacterized protein NFIA_005350 [Aspergillus fischeri NRRL 181]|uniref:Uncharacterized protein n=1 Tax=Neosartorya fischeri (strain ATCC 1020 / DSM 3700 / CBS 544.65 / FGSC A1164 / JCM 1740 / NRRL 181 / WB 181) TaxID=331117 RepID=A1DKD4_NEOFI|nr:uncharacterized protein NFIA_005350 [Aspergillus fischeri NRRL 181]EAW17173.1 hypothetical protein NFIA_005350 [Aspergillus fischeri NRRL 181]
MHRIGLVVNSWTFVALLPLEGESAREVIRGSDTCDSPANTNANITGSGGYSSSLDLCYASN